MEISTLLAKFNLSEDDIKRQITDEHIECISHNLCGKWRSLPAHLQLEPIIVDDVDRLQVAESEKRLNFFKEWKMKQGCEATYEKLTHALLRTNQRQDAESVLQKCSAEQQIKQEKQQQHQETGEQLRASAPGIVNSGAS